MIRNSLLPTAIWGFRSRWPTTLTVALLLLVWGSVACADQLDDFISGSGELGKFGVDVMQDFAEGNSAEDTGMNRLKDLIKGKSLDWLREQTTGGGDISEGMGLILNQIHEGVAARGRTSGGRQGICDLAAINQAWAITFDAKNARLLRGAGNVWFDLMTSAIPNAPALAEKLVMSTGKVIYEKTRAEVESRIKAAWAKTQPESFDYSRTSGPCTLNLKVIWNKKKGAYLFIITGKCDCKLVSGGGRSITMRGFTILGGGTANIVLDDRQPNRPKIRYRVGRPQVKMKADCNCGGTTTIIEDPPSEDPITLPETGLIEREVLQPRCEACWPKLEAVQGYVGEINRIATEMNTLRTKIEAEKFKTPERDANLTRWNQLSQELAAAEKQHDKAFQEFYDCEQTECQLGDEQLRYPVRDLVSDVSTFCEECQEAANAVNAEIAKLNPIISQMNSIAQVTKNSEVRLGTTLGNATYRRWNQLLAQYSAQNQAVEGKKRDLSVCRARECGGSRWDPFKLERPASGACNRCKVAENNYNNAVARHNRAVEIVNDYLAWEKSHVLENGDQSDASLASMEAKKQETGYRQALGSLSRITEELNTLGQTLRDCIRRWCTNVDDTVIGIGAGVTLTNPEDATDRTSYGTIIEGAVFEPPKLPKVPNKISTNCTPCQAIVEDYNRTIDTISRVQGELTQAYEELRKADLYFNVRAAEVNAFELATREYDANGNPTDYIVSTPSFESGSQTTSSGMVRYEQSEFNQGRDAAIARRDEAQTKLVAAKAKVQDLEFQHDVAWKRLTARVIDLVRCERQCATVVIRDVRILTGNNSYDPRDPTAEDSTQIGIGPTSGATSTSTASGTSPSTSGASEPTIQVVNNIPISRLTLAAPDACLANHYHGDANNCNGVFTVDPNPPACGHGTVNDVASIPVSACPDL
ncbi:MAG: hypothetical protein AAF384_14280 [Pseudomonadota bacterium]